MENVAPSAAPRNPLQNLTLASDWHRVGAGLAVRFELRSGRLSADWRTRAPTKREWKRVIGRYRAARDAFLRVVVTRAGGQAAAVVECGQ